MFSGHHDSWGEGGFQENSGRNWNKTSLMEIQTFVLEQSQCKWSDVDNQWRYSTSDNCWQWHNCAGKWTVTLVPWHLFPSMEAWSHNYPTKPEQWWRKWTERMIWQVSESSPPNLRYNLHIILIINKLKCLIVTKSKDKNTPYC